VLAQKGIMGKFTSILAGLVCLLVPIYMWIVNLGNFGSAATLFLQGGLMWGFISLGLVLLFTGLLSLKD